MAKNKKIGSFEIHKFSSASLKDAGYKIKIEDPLSYTPYGERVKLAENTFLEVVQRVRDVPVDFDRVQSIDYEIKKIGKKKNSNENRQSIKTLLDERDVLVYIPSVVAIKFDNKSHYKSISEYSLFVNGARYRRVLAGAGNIRRETVFFIDEDIYDDVVEILNCGRDKSQKLNPAKFSAYFGLYASAGTKVSTPSFTVIPDYMYKRMGTFDYIDATDADTNDSFEIEERETEVEMNAFDGAGLISPDFARRWGYELGLDYIPSTFIFRSAFLKGQVATFDFVRLAKRLNTFKRKDIYGNEFDIRDIDIVFTESQFKLWDSYSSIDDYLSNVLKYEIPFRVSRVSHQFPKTSTTTNYMFLNALGDMSDNDVESLCGDTVNYFKDIQRNSPIATALYQSGESIFDYDFHPDNFWDLDIITKGVLAYPELLDEEYFSSRISASLEKKMKEAKLGKLVVEGNYSPMTPDPYALAQWAIGVDVTGLLEENDFYSEFWNERNVDKVAMARSPLTHSSEMQVVELKGNPILYDWYKYQGSSIIFPYNSLMVYFLADGDFDGDLSATFSHPTIIDNKIDGNPIDYEHGAAKKINISDKDLQKGDLDGFGSKIGFITNTSSTYHVMKYLYPIGSPERDEIEKRLVVFRFLQGQEIDSAKTGGSKFTIPEDWVKYRKDMSAFDKKLMADQRPYFTRYLYDGYGRQYNDETRNNDRYCYSRFGLPFSEIEKNPDSHKKKRVVENFYKYSFFLYTASPMNRITWHIEKSLSDIKTDIVSNGEFEYDSLYSSLNPDVDHNKLDVLKEFMEKYIIMKRVWRRTSKDFKKDIWDALSQVKNDVLTDVSSNEKEIGDLCVSLLISTKRADSFVWGLFGDYVIENILNRYGRQITIPVRDDFGNINFLYNKYSTRRIYV